MKEVVEKIIKEENTARNRIAEARMQAKKFAAEAELEAKKMLNTARQQSRQEVQIMLDKAQAEAEAKKKALLQETVNRCSRLAADKQQEIAQAIIKSWQVVSG